jgi:hypothetical protein
MWFYSWSTFDMFMLLSWVSVSSWEEVMSDLSKIRQSKTSTFLPWWHIFSLTCFCMESINSHSNWCALVVVSSKIARISTCPFHVNNAVFSQILLQNNPVFFAKLKQTGLNVWKGRSHSKIKVLEQSSLYRYKQTSNLERGLGSGCQK